MALRGGRFAPDSCTTTELAYDEFRAGHPLFASVMARRFGFVAQSLQTAWRVDETNLYNSGRAKNPQAGTWVQNALSRHGHFSGWPVDAGSEEQETMQ